MYQKDTSIIQRTNIQSDVLVVNQCDENRFEEFKFRNKNGEVCNARIFHTTERGLSKSRNMAICHAKGDICLICDDDEILNDNYVSTIIKTHETNLKASIIVFQLYNRINNKRGPLQSKRFFWLLALRTASVQITFKRKDLLRNNISFDETLGAGVSKAGGEENKFLFDSLKKGLILWTEPTYIGSLIPNSTSSWFCGYDKDYLIDRGKASRKLLGVLGAIVYNCLWCFHNRNKLDYSFIKSFKYVFSGIVQ